MAVALTGVNVTVPVPAFSVVTELAELKSITCADKLIAALLELNEAFPLSEILPVPAAVKLTVPGDETATLFTLMLPTPLVLALKVAPDKLRLDCVAAELEKLRLDPAPALNTIVPLVACNVEEAPDSVTRFKSELELSARPEEATMLAPLPAEPKVKVAVLMFKAEPALTFSVKPPLTETLLPAKLTEPPAPAERD